METQPRLSDWMSIITLGVIWGGTFMVVTIALQGYGPLTVACARTTFGAIGLLALMRILHRPMPNPAPGLWPLIVASGLLSTAVPFVLLSWGQQHVPSAFAGVSMASVPIFVLPLAHFFAGERLNLRKSVGVALGFSGALLLIGPGLLLLGRGAEPLAQLACVGAALCYAVSSIVTRRCPPVDPITLAALSLTIGAAALWPLMLVFEGVPAWSGTVPGVAIILLGLVPTAFATLLRVSVIRAAGPGFMTLVNYQVPAWSMVFGALILSEALPGRFFVALALILTGLVISQFFSLRKMLFGR
ncbi:membrane protein [Actibacterium mucosum KCTC 23349]|uniref:Membrane protein n=1 Tax=Actibacterium mucosum KCTC 23349 TaxID=1454373 RepID=A0A037ZFA4_9RHOB|nr:DMT family transporter [Actibacterium mucosum]KAJ54221.1 membrane protein [Actibacterium mucosum KCTC 23349]